MKLELSTKDEKLMGELYKTDNPKALLGLLKEGHEIGLPIPLITPSKIISDRR